MDDCSKVVRVDALGGRRLRVVFSDGLIREITMLANWTGIFAPLNDDDVLQSAVVDPVAGTVSWPGGIDVDPDVLHGDFEPDGEQFFIVDREALVA